MQQNAQNFLDHINTHQLHTYAQQIHINFVVQQNVINYLIHLTMNDTNSKPQTNLFHYSSFHQSVVSGVQYHLQALLFSQMTWTGQDLRSLAEASDIWPSVAFQFDCNVSMTLL